MKDYYKILGVDPAASQDRIRRAYRTLARRMHPDVNPGKTSADRFKEIAEAYNVLKNAERRMKYDRQLAAEQLRRGDARMQAYQKNQQRAEQYFREQKQDYDFIKSFQRPARAPSTPAPPKRPPIGAKLRAAAQALYARVSTPKKTKEAVELRHLSVLEVPLSLHDAIYGCSRSIEVEDERAKRTLRVKIPPGVRHGSIVRLRARGGRGEEVLCIIKVERQPGLYLDPEGLVIEVPITVHEAITGATLTIPTFTEPEAVKVQPNTQSGTKIRVKGKGIPLPDGPGDLFVRVMVHVPESELAVGIKEKSAELDKYYESPVREHMPQSIPEMLGK